MNCERRTCILPTVKLRDIAAHLGLNADIFGKEDATAAKRRKNGQTAELKDVADENAGVRLDGVVAKMNSKSIDNP